MKNWLGAAVVLTLGCIPPPPVARAADTAPVDFSAIDRGFICPEALPDDAARRAALAAFFQAYAKAAPSQTVSDMIRYRDGLLEKHHCAKTLRSIAGASEAVHSGTDLQAQAWLPIKSFPEAQLYISTDHLKPTLDPRFPAEREIETYAKIVFKAPMLTSATHIRYDQVISHVDYYCQSGRYALIENDYFLFGTEVLKDPSPWTTVGGVKVFDLTPTPDGSFNAVAARWACDAAKGGAA